MPRVAPGYTKGTTDPEDAWYEIGNDTSVPAFGDGYFARRNHERSIYMRCVMIPALAAAVALLALPAAADVSFDFEGTVANPITDGGSTTQIEGYMSEVYGSTVKAYNVRGENGAEWYTAWPGYTPVGMTPAGQLGLYGAMSFASQPFHFLFVDKGVQEIQFDLAVLDDGTDPGGASYDFEFYAYDATYGNRWAPNPGALITSMSWSSDRAFSANSGAITLPRAAHMIIMSDSGTWDIGVDNMRVVPIPAPGAAVLGLIGLGLVARAKRRFA
jgi:hypothetical protein